MKNSYDECSSLKHFNFQNWTNEKILEKYEVVLTSREKQITDLSIEIGSLNDKLAAIYEKSKALAEENEMLKNRLQKRENLLNQELNNKEIMFMRLERSEQECDDLKKKLEQYARNYQMPINKPKEQQLNVIKENVNQSLENKTIENNIKKDVSADLPVNKVEVAKGNSSKGLSALEKIRELKEKKNVSSTNRISFSSSVIEATPSEKIDNFKKSDPEIIKEEPVKEEKVDHEPTKEEPLKLKDEKVDNEPTKEEPETKKPVKEETVNNEIVEEEPLKEEQVQNESENVEVEFKSKKSKKRHNK